MKEILDFLRDLDNNNHREWFNANKDRYQEVLKKWYAFCESLITEIGRFDKDIAPLTIKDCTYRIYRDTRFSKDKSPYKTHFGAFLAKGGQEVDACRILFPYRNWQQSGVSACPHAGFGQLLLRQKGCQDIA